MKKLKKVFTVIVCIVGVLVVGFTVLVGAVGGFGPFRFIFVNAKEKLAGNAEKYHLENVVAKENSPIEGKTIYFLGSSVTKGEHSLDVSFADYIGKLDSVTIVKEAVSGTTLVDTGSNSYVSRMVNNIDKNADMDAFVCQLSTNDATGKKPLGEISTSQSLDDFDTETIIGALEYIIVYAQETWNCPVVFYTGTKYDSELYGQMVDALLQLQEKYEIGVIDLWHNSEMNEVSESDYALYMSDKIHPTQAGYLEWWTPVMEEYLYEYLAE